MAEEEADRDASRTGQFQACSRRIEEVECCRSGCVSSVCSARTLPYPTGGNGCRPPYHLAQRRFPRLALRLQRPGKGIRITGISIGSRREVDVITVSTGAEFCMY